MIEDPITVKWRFSKEESWDDADGDYFRGIKAALSKVGALVRYGDKIHRPVEVSIWYRGERVV